jgi:gluconolactonase
MFSAPLSLATETAFELPGYLHESGAHNAWVAANASGRDVGSFFGDLAFDHEGRLWVSDTPFGRIFRVTPTGEWDLIVRYDGWPCGLEFHPDGRLIVADQRHGLLALDVESRKISPWITHCRSQRFIGVFALVFATNGDCYFSDRGQSGLADARGAVYCLQPDGALAPVVEDIPGPAGLVLTADQRHLLVAATFDNAIWRVPLSNEGAARAGRFIQLSAGAGPVGLAIDSDDNLFVAHDGLGAAWQFDRRGEPKYRIDSTRGDWTCALARHPHHPNELFIAEAQTGAILKAVLPMY